MASSVVASVAAVSVITSVSFSETVSLTTKSVASLAAATTVSALSLSVLAVPADFNANTAPAANTSTAVVIVIVLIHFLELFFFLISSPVEPYNKKTSDYRMPE